MGDLVNLNKFRKAKQRRTDEAQAGINREKFGRPKAQTKHDQKSREESDKLLDGAKVDEEDGKKPGR